MENLAFERKRRTSTQAPCNSPLDCFQKSASAKSQRLAYGFFADLIS